MKKIINYTIAIAVLLLAATSCTDVLDQQAVDTFNEQVVFSDIYIVKAFLGKCYDRMGGNTDAGILGMREDLLSSATDQTLCIHRPSNYVNLKGTMSPDQLGYFANNGYGGFLRWNNLYSNIQNVNTVIASIDAVEVTPAQEALKKQLKGEAYFIRAYMYAQLLFGHGGVVLSKDPFKLGQDFLTLKRSTIAETKDFIVADIAQAISLLPATGIEQGRANQAACGVLKSRLLLFCASKLTNGGFTAEAGNTLISFPAGSQTALLQAARDAAKLVMDGTYGIFSLAGSTAEPALPLTEAQVKAYSENYFNIFNQKGAWNKETIWGIQFPVTGGNQNNANLWFGPSGYHNWGNNDPTEPAVRSFEMADGTPFVWDKYTPGDQVLRTATAAQLAADPLRSPYNGREPRFYAIVFYHGAPWQTRPADAVPRDPLNQVQLGGFYKADGTKIIDGVDTRAGGIESGNASKTGYYLKKFLDPATVGQFFRNTNTWVEFRYAEILLNYAEACIELGTPTDLTNGINALNMVRNRAGLPDRSLASTQTQARAFIRQERAIEFFGEGHRWYDQRRWMTCGTEIVNVYEMKIKQFDNGNFEWKYDLGANADSRTWGGDKFYWLPIPRDEMTKAPQLINNPGYL